MVLRYGKPYYMRFQAQGSVPIQKNSVYSRTFAAPLHVKMGKRTKCGKNRAFRALNVKENRPHYAQNVKENRPL